MNENEIRDMFNEYQIKASRTLNCSVCSEAILQNCKLGLIGESGEVADVIKKHLFPVPIDATRKMLMGFDRRKREI